MKLGLAPPFFALAALALASGCKGASNTSIPTDGTGGPSIDSTLAPTEADKCFEKCDVDHQAGNAKFEALDACMEDKCKDIDDSTDNRPSCAAIDQGKVTYSYAPTDKCMATACCALAQACADDAACAGLSACFTRCSGMR